jgi:DNA polymerase III sliding clamp (beta) subunit (PCNA family)
MFSVNTKELSDRLDILSKCCVNNALAPITSNVNIKNKDGKLQLITTDTKTFIYATLDDVDMEDALDIFVNMTILQGIIKYCKTEDVEFEIVSNDKENYVKVVSGKGEYKIPIINPSTDMMIPPHNVDLKKATTINTTSTEFSEIFRFNKAFLDNLNMNNPTYHYYLGAKKSVTGDGFKMCRHNTNLDIKEGLIFDRKLVEVLKDCTGVITWSYTKEFNYFECENKIDVYSIATDKTYPIEKIEEFLDNIESDKNLTIGVATLKNILNKINLFVSPLQSNAISFNVDKTTTISNYASNNAEEELELQHTGKFKFVVDGKDLLALISSIEVDETTDDLITMHYTKNDDIEFVGIKTEGTSYVLACLAMDED